MTRPSRLSPLVLPFALALLAGCSLVSPEAKVRDRLIGAGLKPAMAQCMAHKLVKHLDSAQLQALARVAKPPADHPGKVRIEDVLERIQSLNDPKIVEVTTRAGLSCAIMG